MGEVDNEDDNGERRDDDEEEKVDEGDIVKEDEDLPEITGLFKVENVKRDNQTKTNPSNDNKKSEITSGDNRVWKRKEKAKKRKRKP